MNQTYSITDLDQGVLLVNKVLVEGPSDYTADPLAHYPGEEAPEVPQSAICLVYLDERVVDPTVVLSLVLVVVLEVHACSYQVKWVGYHTAGCIRRETCDCCDECEVKGAVRHILTLMLSVEAKHYHEVLLEEVVDRVEDAREGHIANQ